LEIEVVISITHRLPLYVKNRISKQIVQQCKSKGCDIITLHSVISNQSNFIDFGQISLNFLFYSVVMMISGTRTAFSAMRDASDRAAEIAHSIANGGPVHANIDDSAPNKPKASEEVGALSTPVSASPDASPAMQLVDLKQTELVFKTSALTARTLIETSQELMDALR
jgi:hypothetical protein